MSDSLFNTIATIVLTPLFGGLLYVLKSKHLRGKLKGIFCWDILRIWGDPKANGKKFKTIEFLFSEPDGKIDCVIYQMGIRPTIPLMDCIYHLYLKSLLQKGAIAKVAIFATQDLSAPNQNDDEKKTFEENTRLIYGDQAQKIYISFLNKEATLAAQLISKEFSDAVKNIEGHNLIESWKRKLAENGTVLTGNITKTIEWAAKSRKQRGFFNFIHHINRTWIICCSLSEIIPQLSPKPKEQLRIGSILWEVELAKYGVLHEYFRQQGYVITHDFILAKSVTDGIKKSSIPTHEHDKAICIYDDMNSSVTKMESKSWAGRRSHVFLLRLIANEINSGAEDSIAADIDFAKRGRKVLDNMVYRNQITINISKLRSETHQAVGLINYISSNIKA